MSPVIPILRSECSLRYLKTIITLPQAKHVTFLLARVTLQRKMLGANQSGVSHLLPSKSTIGCDLHIPPSSWPHDTKFCKSSFLKNNICFQISKWQYQLIRHNNLILVVNKLFVPSVMKYQSIIHDETSGWASISFCINEK